jgi:hypothetical protein
MIFSEDDEITISAVMKFGDEKSFDDIESLSGTQKILSLNYS